MVGSGRERRPNLLHVTLLPVGRSPFSYHGGAGAEGRGAKRRLPPFPGTPGRRSWAWAVTPSVRDGGGTHLTPSPGARLGGGALGVGRLRGRGWRRPRSRRLRDEREEPKERREMGR